MLGTLMKYEFKAVGRILLPLYGAWIIVAIMLGLSLRSDGISEPNNFMIIMSAVLYAFATVAAVVITSIILIQRFYKNLLGNEGYFMFALPISTGKHLANKIISGAVWTFIGVLAAILTAFAIAISIEGFTAVFDGFYFMVGEVRILLRESPSSFIIIIEIILIALVAMAETAAKIYAAISIGHQWGNHRVLGAILAYAGIGIAEGIIGTIIEFVAEIIPMGWFYELEPMMQGHLSMILALIACTMLLSVYWFISWILLDKKLNLE